MIGRVNGAVSRVFCALAGVCLGAMTVIVLLQVFCRYVLNAPLSWPEEAARFLMVWMTFLVAPYAYREGLLVRLETWVGYLPARGRQWVEIAMHAFAILTLLVLLRETWWMTERGGAIRSSALDLSMRWVFVVMPVSIVLLISVAMESIVKTIKQNGDRAAPEAAQ